MPGINLGAGANGGSAIANSATNSLGLGNASSTATATGGSGGNASSGPGGLGGNATATATAIGLGLSNATATANGGFGIGRSYRGTGLATANATGTSGTAKASAASAGGFTALNLSTQSTAPVSGTSRAQAEAGTASPALDASHAIGLQSAVLATATPKIADVQNFFAGNPHAQSTFTLGDNSSPSAASDVLGLVTMGGGYSDNGIGSHTYTSSASFTLDMSLLFNPPKELMVAFLDNNTLGNGFDTMTFQITRENALVLDKTFTTVADAQSYFNDALVDLGSNDPTNISGNLDLAFSLSLTSATSGAGFAFDLAFGNGTPGPVGLTGDYNHNGIVDAADYTVWRDSLGCTAVPSPPTAMAMASSTPVTTTCGSRTSATIRHGSGVSANAAVPEPATIHAR